MPCFTKSPSPIPFSDVNLASHTAHSPRWGPDSSTSEVTTLQLEFRDLSRSSKDPKFEVRIQLLFHFIWRERKICNVNKNQYRSWMSQI